MIQRVALLAGFALVLGAGFGSAGEQPLQGEFLRLSTQRRPGVVKIRLGAVGSVPDERARAGADPRLAGAHLEILGDNVLGADAPPVPLPRQNWRALGEPPGSRGFRYFDASCRFGVRRASLRFGRMASFSFAGGGPAWPYRTSGRPATVMVRLSIGDEVFCTTFDAFQQRRRGAMVAGHNPPPVSCQYESASASSSPRP